MIAFVGNYSADTQTLNASAKTASVQNSLSSNQLPLKVTLRMENARLEDVVKRLGEKYKLNIVADCYADDPPLPKIQVEDVPLRLFLAQMGQMYQRDVLNMSGIIVFRHTQYFLKPEADRNVSWNGRDEKAPIVIAPETNVSTASTIAPGKISNVAVDTATPPRYISGSASASSVQKFAEGFTQNVKWPVSFDPELQKRHISVTLNHISPGLALEAVSTLFDAAESVAIGPSEAQKKRQEALAKSAMDSRSEREKESDKLRPALLKALSPEQREKVKNGEEVKLSLADMSPELRGQALAYVGMSAAELQKEAGADMDPSSFGRFTLVFLPPGNAPTGQIGVYGTNSDGTQVRF